MGCGKYCPGIPLKFSCGKDREEATRGETAKGKLRGE